MRENIARSRTTCITQMIWYIHKMWSLPYLNIIMVNKKHRYLLLAHIVWKYWSQYNRYNFKNIYFTYVFAHIFHFNFSWIWLVSFNFLLQNGFVDCPIYNREHSTLIQISNEEKIMPIHLHANVLKPKRGKAFKSQFTFIFIFF